MGFIARNKIGDIEPREGAGRPVLGVPTALWLALLTVGLALPLLVFSGYLIWREAGAERQRNEAELRQTAAQIAIVMDREFAYLVTLLQAIAASPGMETHDFSALAEQTRALHGLPDVNIVMRDIAGKVLFTGLAAYGSPQSNVVIVRDHDAELIRNRVPLMSNVHISPFGRGSVVSAVLPIVEGGEVRFFLQANLPTEHFDKLLNGFNLENDTGAFILDRNDAIVSRTNRLQTEFRPGASGWQPDAEGLANGLNERGEPVVAAIVQSRLTGWRIGVSEPEAALVQPTNRALSDLALLGFASTGIGLLFAFAVGRRISTSIHSLAAVGADLQQNAPLVATPLREINDVARTLYDANAQLRASETRLRESQERLRLALQAGRAFVFEADVPGDRIGVFGAGAAEVGISETETAQIDGKSCRQRVHPADYRDLVNRIARLTPAAPTLSMQFRYRRQDQDFVWLSLQATSAFDAAGRLASVSGLAVDVTADKHAEEARARLAAIVETSRDMIISVEPGGKILTWNAGAERMFGYTAEEAVGESLRMLAPPESNDFDIIVEQMKKTGSVRVETLRQAKDGRRLNVQISASSVFLPDGTRGSSAIFTDISERKLFEERQATLISELNHRVKNTLATVQSIAMHSFRDPLDRAPLRAFMSRLIALSEAHNVLTNSSWEGADLGEILQRTVAPHQMSGASRFQCSGPPLWLEPRAALALAMAIHELCTNAAKYGALSNPTGLIKIEWTTCERASSERLRVRWQEVGGPLVTAPGNPGFGTRLVRGVLTDDLGADVTLKFEEAGVVCEFEAPLGDQRASRQPGRARCGGGST